MATKRDAELYLGILKARAADGKLLDILIVLRTALFNLAHLWTEVKASKVRRLRTSVSQNSKWSMSRTGTVELMIDLSASGIADTDRLSNLPTEHSKIDAYHQQMNHSCSR